MLKPTLTDDPKQLPELAYKAMFEDHKVFYKGEMLRQDIVKDRRFAADQAIRVGDYMYMKQSMVGDSEWAQKARAGKNIMWIIQIDSGEVLARVEDGEVTRLDK